MGIIYDTMRRNFSQEEEEYTSPYEDYNLISFCDFIGLLELHTDDDSKMVCEYLINEDTFLKLDIYTHDMKNASVGKGFAGFIGHKYDAYHEYDGFKFNKELEYPTENFLEDFMLENGTSDYDDYYYWKIDDLLELDCMANIGLNENSFGLCQSAMNGNARIILELNKQNKELMASLNELYANAENNELERVKDELADVKAQNEKLIADNEENKATGSFSMGAPTVAHGEDKTYEQLVEALAAANDKIKQHEEDINRLNDQLNKQADKHLYDWQAMNKNQYPPELHLAMEIWGKYYQAGEIEYITQFNTGKFNRIANELNLKDGNLKDRIRTLLTPLVRKLKAPSLIESFDIIDIIHTEKLEQD